MMAFYAHLVKVCHTTVENSSNHPKYDDFCDSSEEYTTMKENPNKMLFDCDFGGKETNPIHFKETGNYESLNPSRNGPLNSTGNDVLKGPFYRPRSKDADSSHPDSNENQTTTKDSLSSDKNKVKDSILTKPDTSGDKNVFKNDGPELIVCYEEIVSRVMKDICLDEGTPLGSFFSSFDGKENHKTEQCVPDQKRSASSYGSKIERTFDFEPTLSETARVSNDKPENVMIQSFESTNMHGLKNSGPHNSIRETSIEKGSKELSKVENGFLDFSEAENGPDQSLSNFKDDDSFKVNGNESVVDREKYEHDEPSFSDSALVSHSAAIPFSGSISFRSDGSATSGRSFAFPILQSEWSSSPIKMAKADRTQLRKHKFWRSRLLCCRF